MLKNRRSKSVKKDLYQELNRVVDKIKINYQPERIILFGSLAVGVPNQSSDIDLAIVKKTNKRFLDRNLEVALIADPLEAFDFLVYTPKEWQEMQKKNNYFIKEINKGKILYEKG
ncbi:MAG: nucleotidyltransferase domain-containing protein [bacterium]